MVSIVAETSINLDTSGNLTITDANGGTSNDMLTLSINGTNLRITDPNNTLSASGVGVTSVNSNTVDVALSNFTGNLIIDTQSGTDILNFNLSNMKSP